MKITKNMKRSFSCVTRVLYSTFWIFLVCMIGATSLSAQVNQKDCLIADGKRKAVLAKLKEIKIPRIDLENCRFSVALDRLNCLIRENDPAQLPQEKGISILVEQGVSSKRIETLSLSNVTGLEVLRAFIETEKSVEFSLTSKGVNVRVALPAGNVPMPDMSVKGASLGDVIKRMEAAGIGSQNPVSIICIPESLKEAKLPDFSIQKTNVHKCAKLVTLLLSQKQQKVKLVEVDKNVIAFKLDK